MPSLLPKNQPPLGRWQDYISFQYRYNVFIDSIISRFIVKANRYIQKNLCWRSGVMLSYTEGLHKAEALVEADRDDQIIVVSIQGEAKLRKTFRKIIKELFEETHRAYVNLGVNEYLVLPSNAEVLVDYESLLRRYVTGEVTYTPDKANQPVNVEELLALFEEDYQANSAHLDKSKSSKFLNLEQSPLVNYVRNLLGN